MSRSSKTWLSSIHDFSEFWAGTPRGNLLPDGRFEPYPLGRYWETPGWPALLIWHDGILAGFALVNDDAHSRMPVSHNMAEFFILRKHRGQGIGRLAATFIFSRYPGTWEVAIARKNTAAHHFWRKVIHGSKEVNGIYEGDICNNEWNGPIIRFDWGGE